MSDLATIADSIAASLSLAGLGVPFTVTRGFVPTYNPVKTPGINCYVVPIGVDYERETKTMASRMGSIVIAIYNAIGFDEYGSHDTTELDAMLDFTEKVCDYFLTNYMIADAGASIIAVANPVSFDAGMLDDDNVFATVITLKTLLTR